MADTPGRSRGIRRIEMEIPPTTYRRADQHGTSPVYFRKICFFYRSGTRFMDLSGSSGFCMHSSHDQNNKQSFKGYEKEYVSNLPAMMTEDDWDFTLQQKRCEWQDSNLRTPTNRS